MSPFHPKLRRALLREPAHRKNKETKLTPDGLLYYESLVTKFYYLKNYHDPVISIDTKQIIGNIQKFHQDYFLKFDEIHSNWVKAQKRAIKYSYYGLNPAKIFTKSFILLWSWLKAVIIRRKINYATID